MAHDEPPYQDPCCLQSQLFSSELTKINVLAETAEVEKKILLMLLMNCMLCFTLFLLVSILYLKQRASVVLWFIRAMTVKHWISHRCGPSLARDTCEIPSSAPVSQEVFLWVLRFSPTSD